MQCPRAAIFDLDDTLAESFKRPSDEVLEKLTQLLEHITVAIMTGSGFRRMEAQFLDVIAAAPRSDRFYLFPNSSAQCFTYNSTGWTQQYNFALTPDERTRIKAAILEVVGGNELLRETPHWGERMFDREAQVAYTPVGVEATLEVKRSWDPDGMKRNLLRDLLKHALPDFEILLGGTTTVDITRKGINKAHGVRWLAERLNIPAGEMLYVGDAFHEGGNDLVVVPTGIQTRAVSGPAETPQVLDELLKACVL
jgi:phosphomannomutase